MSYVRRESVVGPFGMEPKMRLLRRDSLPRVDAPYVRFCCGEKTHFDVSLALVSKSETISRLFTDLNIGQSSLPAEEDGLVTKTPTIDRTDSNSTVLNDEPIALPFSADTFELLLKCLKSPGQEAAHLEKAPLASRAELMKLCDYLNLAEHTRLFTRSFATMFDHKSPAEIARMLSIRQDLTPQDIAKLQSKGVWNYGIDHCSSKYY